MPIPINTKAEVSKSSETVALEQDYDRGWYWILDQLDKAFVDDVKMLDRTLFRAKAKVWSRTANPMAACGNPEGISGKVDAIVLEDWQLAKVQEHVMRQCGLRDRLAESLGVPSVGEWRSGLSGHQVRRKVHYAWTIMAAMKLCRPPPMDPYRNRRGTEDPQRQADAEVNAAAWTEP